MFIICQCLYIFINWVLCGIFYSLSYAFNAAAFIFLWSQVFIHLVHVPWYYRKKTLFELSIVYHSSVNFKIVTVYICNYLLSCDYKWSNREHSYEVMYTDIYISYIMAVVFVDLMKCIPPVPAENQPTCCNVTDRLDHILLYRVHHKRGTNSQLAHVVSGDCYRLRTKYRWKVYNMYHAIMGMNITVQFVLL